MDSPETAAPEIVTPRWRRVVWWTLIYGVLVPAIWAPLAAIGIALTFAWAGTGWVPATVAVLTLALAVRLGRKFGRRGVENLWPDRNGPLFGAIAGVAAFVTLVGSLLYPEISKTREAARDKMILNNFRALADAEAQLFQQQSGRFVLFYDDVVKNDGPVRSVISARDENYAAFYPRHFGQPFVYRKTDGTTVMFEPLAPTNAPGAPPSPRRFVLPGGGRLEFEVRADGVQHGRVRAYRPNGAAWLEAVCVEGKLEGKAWITRDDGTRFDALAEKRQRP